MLETNWAQMEKSGYNRKHYKLDILHKCGQLFLTIVCRGNLCFISKTGGNWNFWSQWRRNVKRKLNFGFFPLKPSQTPLEINTCLSFLLSLFVFFLSVVTCGPSWQTHTWRQLLRSQAVNWMRAKPGEVKMTTERLLTLRCGVRGSRSSRDTHLWSEVSIRGPTTLPQRGLASFAFFTLNQTMPV